MGITINTILKRFCRFMPAAGCVCLLLFFPAEAGAKTELPEQYAQIVQQYFAEEQWAEGKKVLDEALEAYPSASDLQWLTGKYWHHEKDYDRARYHLVRAVEANYDNVQAKQLLVDVEEMTGNYSSAICYVNELLEVNPYWRGLWRRKIVLYRKQGNDVEADRLLRRINQIYPDDTVLRKDYIYTMELNYQKQKRDGDRKEAIGTLDELLKKVPDNEQYYLDLINLYLQEGDQERALGLASNGLAAIPGSVALILKKVGILEDLARYPEALAFMHDRMKRTGEGAALSRIYDNLLQDAARAEKQRDPYVLYGMSYERGAKDRETLDYLLNTAITRGYDDDALFYLHEAKKRYGTDDKSLLYKEYLLYRRMNGDEFAYTFLCRLYDRYPDDYDIAAAVCAYRLAAARRLMEQGAYAEALPYARFVAGREPDPETGQAAWERVVGCYIGLKRYPEALAALDTLAGIYPASANLTGRRALILDGMGRTPEALQVYRTAIENADGDMRMFYVIGYEELSVPYIRRCMEAGATRRAYDAAQELLRFNPSSDPGLRYAVNAAALLGDRDGFREYAERGLAFYPEEPFFLVKKAALLDQENRFDASIALLQPWLGLYPGSGELTGAFSQSSEFRALQLIKAKEPDSAMVVIDTALFYDPLGKSLRYTKGMVFELQKQYDSAYYYQKFYEPGAAEQHLFRRHLIGLQNRTFKNEVGLQYLQSRYGDEDAITSIASLEYTRKALKDIYTGRFNYAGRNGGSLQTDPEYDEESAEKGGVGVQLQGEWTHRFSHTWEGKVNLAWADRYFPKLTANVSATKFLKKDWEVEMRAGYRYLSRHSHLLSAGPGVAKTWGPLWVNAKADIFCLESNVYYNVMAQARYFPLDDGRTHVAAMAGIGSAPELAVVDMALPGAFSHANTMVGLGGQYLLTPNIAIGLMGTWYTYYSQKIDMEQVVRTKYRNLYNIYAQVYISF